jgi:hypothetical protein
MDEAKRSNQAALNYCKWHITRWPVASLRNAYISTRTEMPRQYPCPLFQSSEYVDSIGKELKINQDTRLLTEDH